MGYECATNKYYGSKNPLSELMDLSETRTQVDRPLMHLTLFNLSGFVLLHFFHSNSTILLYEMKRCRAAPICSVPCLIALGATIICQCGTYVRHYRKQTKKSHQKRTLSCFRAINKTTFLNFYPFAVLRRTPIQENKREEICMRPYIKKYIDRDV